MFLCKATRDGSVSEVSALLELETVDESARKTTTNSIPLYALWHEPGPESTLLHLAVCCVLSMTW